MSILEQIVKTEAKVQKDILNAKEKVENMISDARKSGLEESVLIKEKVDKELEKLKNTFEEKTSSFDNNLQDELNKQHESLVKNIKGKTEKVVMDIYKEVVKI